MKSALDQSLKHRPAGRLAPRGFSLIELMVAMVIGTLVVLAISMVMSTTEGQKRTLTSTNDIDQSGAYAGYYLDKLVRSAGSGFYQASSSLGCNILATYQGAQILPAPAFGASSPFQNVTQTTFQLTPALVLPGEGATGTNSDVLVVMEATNGNSAIPAPFNGVPTATSLNLFNTVGIAANDILLVDDPTTSADCLIDEVSSSFAQSPGSGFLPLGGDWHTGNTFAAQPLDGMTVDGLAADLGNYLQGTQPLFELIGVGSDDTLYAEDLLNPDAGAVAIANGVFEMHILYGIAGVGGAISWESPADYAGYTVASPTVAGLANPAKIPTIKALRIGLILRTQLQEKDAVTPGPIVLFSDLAADNLEVTRALTGTEQNYRYRTLDFTIPLQNALQ